jgi:hypothetical protein
MKNYPNIDKILEAKEARRKALAELSFEEKMEVVSKLAERSKFIKSGRVIEKQASNTDTVKK